jgi:hypothetical protein
MAAAVITASASVFVAMFAFIFNQRAQIQQERRQIRLARVNSQLRELYGPLNMLVDVNERLWERLRSSGLPVQEERNPAAATEDWLRWRDGALMPTNRKMRDIIILHADLLLEVDIPVPLRDFCAHVDSMEIVLAAEHSNIWEATLIPHPGSSYVTYVRASFSLLKKEQQRLLNIK